MSLISYWDFSFFHQMAYYKSQACLQLLNNFQRTSPKEGTGSEQILKKFRSLFALIFPLHNGHILGNWLKQCGRFFCPFSGFLIKPSNGQKGCEVGYVTHTNPRGKIPTWLTNKVTSYVAPRMLRKLHKACIQVNNLQKVPFVHNFIKQN